MPEKERNLVVLWTWPSVSRDSETTSTPGRVLIFFENMINSFWWF